MKPPSLLLPALALAVVLGGCATTGGADSNATAATTANTPAPNPVDPY